jgi:cyclase
MSTWKLILVLLFASLTNAQASDKQFIVNKHSDSSFVLVGKGYGTNVGVIVSEKGLVLIDPMPGEEYLDVLHLLVKGVSNNPISYVLNTHNHEDHTGGNGYFEKKGASIIDQKKGASIIDHNSLTLKSALNSEKSLLHTNYGLEVINVVSHTTQDTIFFHSESNILFVGDVFDNSWHPTFYAGGIDGFAKTIEIILATGDKNTLIVPGHGAPANKNVVKAFYENTLVWLERISELHKEKMSVEQMMQDKQVNEILQRFNTEQRKEFIPLRAFTRFIERTISIVSSDKQS